MSLSSALSNAVSGLTAASRAGQVVSSNVANATTEGYATRELLTSTRVVGGASSGVQVDGVQRSVDAGLLSDRRFADASLAFQSGKSGFLAAIEPLIGSPENDASIAGWIRNFEAALQTAASRPDSEARLSDVLTAAQGLAGAIASASDGVQAERLAADQSIAVQVDRLNANLDLLSELNTEISRLNGAGRDVTGLEDQRQGVIDDISAIVPVREVPRQDGKIALYTDGGAILFDETPKTFTFTPVNTVTPDMTLASGALSGITVDGRPISVTGPFAALGGGSLEAAFVVRDQGAPDLQAALDVIARDLVERFEAPTLDPTTAPGAPGLFTDRGAPLDPTDTIGLAGRLDINAAVDPTRGGSVTRLRDGLGAVTPGDTGNAAQLYAFADALSALQSPSDPSVTTVAGTFAALFDRFSNQMAQDRITADRELGFATARQSSLRALELARGVDTDQEMQKLLLIEQSYAANARVVQTLDTLIQQLISI